MSEQIYLSRRNLLALLSKLDRKAGGEATSCTIVKYHNPKDPFTQSMDSIAVTAVEDEDLYTNRNAGIMHPSDTSDVHTRVAPTPDNALSRAIYLTVNMSDGHLKREPLTGRENGKIARDRAKLDSLDDTGVGIHVDVIANSDTYSISSSFFLGMFEPSIKKLGIAAFKEKYNFGTMPQKFIGVVHSSIGRAEQEAKMIEYNQRNK